MPVVTYRAISIGGEKKGNYAIFKKFQFVPLGKSIVICDIANKSKIPIKWISYYIVLKIAGKTYREKFLHIFKKPVVLDGTYLTPKSKSVRLLRYQSVHSIFSNLGKLHGQKLSAIQFTA